MQKKNEWLVSAIFVVGITAILAPLLFAATGTIWTLTGKGARRNTVEFEIVSPTVGSAANLVPGTTNTNALGTSALRFSDVQTNNATVAGTLTVAGAVVVPTVDVTVTSPTVAGALVKTSAYVLYIATATGHVADWIKVGGQ